MTCKDAGPDRKSLLDAASTFVRYIEKEHFAIHLPEGQGQASLEIVEEGQPGGLPFLKLNHGNDGRTERRVGRVGHASSSRS